MRHRIKYCLFITVLFLCAPPKKIIVLPIPDYFSQAEELFSKNPLTALEFYRTALSQSPDSLLRKKILERMYEIYFDQREYLLAYALSESLPAEPIPTLPTVLISLKKYDEILKNGAMPVLTKAYAAEQLGRLEQALEYYKQAQPLAFGYARLKTAELFYKLGQFDSSKAVLATMNGKPEAEAIELLTEIACAENSWSEAKKYIERLPDSDKKLEYGALVQEKLGKDAAYYYWEAIARFPNTPFARHAAELVKPSTRSQYLSLGQLLLDTDPKTAERYLQKCLTGEFREAAARALARFYLNQGNLNDAEAVLKNNPSAGGQMLLAKVHLRQGLKMAAVNDFLDAARRSPRSDIGVDALYQAGLVLEDLSKPDSACALYLKANKAGLASRAGVLLLLMNKPEKAKEALSRFENPESYYFLGKLHENLGSITQADSLYRQLILHYPLSYWTLKILERPEYEKLSPFLAAQAGAWFASWADTNYTLTYTDSLHLQLAEVFLDAGLSVEATKELKALENNNPFFLYKLSRLCARYGLDARSIYYVDKIIKRSKTKELPRPLIELLFPARYRITIQANGGELPFVLSVIRQESWFQPQALSSAQAYGLMQIIPATGREIARTLGDTGFTVEDLNQPELNIRFGINYLQSMEKQFGSKPFALAAYNGGPGNVQRWQKMRPAVSEDEFIELIPYNETREYVKSCLLGYFLYRHDLNH
jgi:soluble lytic murein transglycosylase-like protein/thioredoxin-like negative regulator of GroEL